MIHEIFDDQELLNGLMGKDGGVIPTFPISLGYAINEYHKKTNINAKNIMLDSKHLARSQMYIRDKFKLPFCISLCDLNVTAEALGTTLTYEDATIPMFEKAAINTLEDVDKLEVADPYKDGRMPTVIGAGKYFIENIKEKNVLIAGGCAGPITAAGSIFGIENLMRCMIREPDVVHKALSIITDSLIEFLNAQLDQGLQGVGIAEPTASCSCISPEFFRVFAFPYLKKILKKINTIGTLLHICGDIDGILHDIARLRGILIMSIDDVSLKKAKEIFAKKMIITLGNVSTTVLLRGTPADVEAEAIRCIKEAGSGGKFFLSTGCDIAVGTPDENIWSLLNAGRKFGTFPIKQL
ncbi:MAG: uroporphyrinogen decarboxylase family protein [Candidatus Helarchaeota archaeon]